MSKTALTYRDYEGLPNDGRRYETHDGARAVEILSPSTRTIDRVTKRRLYARYGVPCLWLVDPDPRFVEVFVLEDDRYVLATTAAGAEPVDLPPFTGLGPAPETLWP